MTGQLRIDRLIETMGGRFSTSLKIELENRDNKEISRWFLAAILFGARIGESIVINTYQEFTKEGITTPKAILNTGWNRLVEILDAGGYVRYDFKTATKLLGIADKWEREYQGDLNLLHDRAENAQDLETRLLEFKGIGQVTANIFLRELRGIWEKASPLLGGLTLLAVQNLGLIETKNPAQASEGLQRLFQRATLSRSYRFSDFESALVRLGKDWCRRGKHASCPLRGYCSKAA